MNSRPILLALALGTSLAAVPALGAVPPSRQADTAGANGSMAVNGTGNNGVSNPQGSMAVNGTGNNGASNPQGSMAESGSGNNGLHQHEGTMAHNGTWNNARSKAGK